MKRITSVVIASVLAIVWSGENLAFGEDPPAFVCKWGSWGREDGKFSEPAGVAVDASGSYVYVADRNNHRIQKFTAGGAFLTKWGSRGSGDGQFDSPYGVAVDASGRVYVTDLFNNRIQKFDADGTFLTKWGSAGAADGQFHYPYGVAIDGAGHVYVADMRNNRIQKFDADGAFLAKWGSDGGEDGQFRSPVAVSADTSGNVYVADHVNSRIQKFTATGVFLRKWTVGMPSGVAVNTEEVYVALLPGNRIQKFTSEGLFLTQWGSGPGHGDGQFAYPWGVAVDATGKIYVADSLNNRIQKFAPSNRPPVAISESVQTLVSSPLGITLTATDPDNDPLTFAIASSPSHGTLTGTPPDMTYLPDSNFTGQDSFTFTVTDGKASSTPATVTITVNDTPPEISPSVTGVLGRAGWYTSDAVVSWSVSDRESGISSSTGCSPATVSGETTETVLTCSATNGAGLTNSVSITLSIDKFAPTVTFGAQSPPANSAGWNNTDVSVPFVASDGFSGVDILSPASPLVFSIEGSALSANVTAADKAGNTATYNSPMVRMDRTPPSITGTRAPAPFPSGWNNSEVRVNFFCADSLSGLAAGSPPPETVKSSEGANQTVTGICLDNAGNQSTTTVGPISIDKTAPAIQAPTDITVDATGPGGALVTYSVTATDNFDPAPVLTCAPQGAFAIGVTTVRCSASDWASNISTQAFKVTVRGAAQQTAILRAYVASLNLGTKDNGLIAKLTNAETFLTSGNTSNACAQLAAFINQTQAKAGKDLTAGQAGQMIADAARIRAVSGCP